MYIQTWNFQHFLNQLNCQGNLNHPNFHLVDNFHFKLISGPNYPDVSIVIFRPRFQRLVKILWLIFWEFLFGRFIIKQFFITRKNFSFKSWLVAEKFNVKIDTSKKSRNRHVSSGTLYYLKISQIWVGIKFCYYT